MHGGLAVCSAKRTGAIVKRNSCFILFSGSLFSHSAVPDDHLAMTRLIIPLGCITVLMFCPSIQIT